jgi:hypothetical protein
VLLALGLVADAVALSGVKGGWLGATVAGLLFGRGANWIHGFVSRGVKSMDRERHGGDEIGRAPFAASLAQTAKAGEPAAPPPLSSASLRPAVVDQVVVGNPPVGAKRRGRP